MDIVASRGYHIATDDVRTTPFSLEAEQAVLGGLMLDSLAWDRMAELITEVDFYEKRHRVIFRAMLQLTSMSVPLDAVTMVEWLERSSDLERAGGAGYLIELAKNTPSVVNIVTYANIVRQRSILRQLIVTSNEIAESAYAPQGRSTTQLLDEAERKIFDIAKQDLRGLGPRTVADVLAIATERLERLYAKKQPLTGVATGYIKLDKMTSGLQPADLIIVAGRPSMGKTVLGLNIAEYVARTVPNSPVLIFSLEMSADALAVRLLSSATGIDQTALRTGDFTEQEWAKFTTAMMELAKTRIIIDDSAALSPSEVRTRARRVAKEHGAISLIVIDYLQLMQIKSGNNENRTQEISEISRSLKALAKELNVPVIALSQLNRELEKRQDKRPMMSDLRESGAIEQDADLILFIYRDEVYNKDTVEFKGKAEVIIGKQRNGPIGNIMLLFRGHVCRFENLDTHYTS